MRNKMGRVLVISEHFPPTVGGTSAYTRNLCRHLAKAGWEVYLVTQPSAGDSGGRWHTEDGVNIYRLRIPRRVMKSTFLPHLFPFYLLKEIDAVFRRVRPDVVHFAAGIYTLSASRLYGFGGVPIVWTIHNLPPAESSSSLPHSGSRTLDSGMTRAHSIISGALAAMQLHFYRFDRIIAVSGWTANKITQKGISPGRVVTIPVGVGAEYLACCAEEKRADYRGHVVLTVGGIVAHKRQLDIVQSVPLVKERFPDAVFLFVGPVRSEQYRDRVKAAIDGLGLSGSVRLVGEVSSDELLSYFRNCDVYLQPSGEEGFCISILEAMSCGKAVVGTPVGEIPRFITESGAGILLSDSSPQQISGAVIRLLSDERMRAEFGERARSYVSSWYGWQGVAERTADVYRLLLEERS
jgi:glycosyltransferase involved in cell wall biosynthesis